MLYSKAMNRVRTGRVARIVAMCFLLWTGVDLINPSLCAIDGQAGSQSARTESTAFTTPAAPQTAPYGGAEDCFCCCQHIVSTAVWVPIPQLDVVQRPTLPPVEHVRVLLTRLDRPPRLA
jgi:hypothetical protein